MRYVYLVKHPEAQHHVDGLVGGWHDSRLTGRGEQQAERIGEALAAKIGAHEVEIISSDLQRAQHTAERIAARFSVSVRTDPRLREKSYGEADGRPESWLKDRRVPPPEHGNRLDHLDGPQGAETLRTLVDRLYPALDDILRRPMDHQIIVSHGTASSYLIAAWIGMPREATDRVFFRMAAGGITTLLRNDWHFSQQVVRLNDTQHLSGI